MLVALQVVGTDGTPLNVTVLVACEEPKFVPVIVTDVPTSPRGGVRLTRVGRGGAVTVKRTPLLATPLAVTTTFPVVAPHGTATTMLESVQLVGVATVPLNVTVFEP